MARTFPYVELKDFSRTYPRFEFPGLRALGYCFLRIDIHNGVPVFLSSAMPNEGRMPLTRVSAAIRRSVIAMLYAENVLTLTRPRKGLMRFSSHLFEERVRRDVINFFDARSFWIRYHPAACTLLNEDVYEFIDFNGGYSPSESLDSATKITGLDASFFLISNEELGLESTR